MRQLRLQAEQTALASLPQPVGALAHVLMYTELTTGLHMLTVTLTGKGPMWVLAPRVAARSSPIDAVSLVVRAGEAIWGMCCCWMEGMEQRRHSERGHQS